MRVLAITNLYPNPYQPHRASWNRHQLRLLGKRHPVQVISPIAWTDEIQWRRKAGALVPSSRRVAHDGMIVDHPVHAFTPGVLRRAYGKFFQWSVQGAFERALREFRPTVVFAPWAYPDGWAAVTLARKANLPVLVKVHGSDILLLPKNPARRRGTEAAVRGADAVLAVSADLKRSLVEMGVAPSHVRVIYDGVDTSVFRPGDKAAARAAVGLVSEEPVVLFVGNLVPVKAIDVLIAACGKLKTEGWPVRLVLIGSGPLRANLEEQAARLGLRDRVELVGSLAQDRLANWYRAADVFVLPSHSEGVPNVLLEASACGAPWVASRVGGIPEIAELGFSRLVPPNDPDRLAAAIREHASAERPAQHARARALEEVVDELEELLRQVETRTLSLASLRPD